MSAPNILVACEYSGIVRDAFRRRGFNAMSCDLLPTDAPGPHYQGDVFDVLKDPGRFFGGPIHMAVMHPPCTFLTNAGARWLWRHDQQARKTVTDERGQRLPVWQRWKDMEEGALFFKALWEADIPRIAVENPVMVGYAKAIIGGGPDALSRVDWEDAKAEPSCSFQPYHHGHMEQKQTCLWLKNLPNLVPSNDVKAATLALPYAERAKVHHASPGPDRWKLRSTFFTGVAEAMADQWGPLVMEDVAEDPAA